MIRPLLVELVELLDPFAVLTEVLAPLDLGVDGRVFKVSCLSPLLSTKNVAVEATLKNREFCSWFEVVAELEGNLELFLAHDLMNQIRYDHGWWC